MRYICDFDNSFDYVTESTTGDYKTAETREEWNYVALHRGCVLSSRILRHGGAVRLPHCLGPERLEKPGSF